LIPTIALLCLAALQVAAQLFCLACEAFCFGTIGRRIAASRLGWLPASLFWVIHPATTSSGRPKGRSSASASSGMAKDQFRDWPERDTGGA